MAGEVKSEAGSSPLTLSLFGPFEVRVNGLPLPCPLARKEQWLLALLVLRAREEVERLWLAGTLWPDSSPGQALHNLRNSLTHLRRALGPEGDRLRSPSFRTLDLDLSDATVDVVAFDAAIACGDPASLARAVALHGGPLLENCVEEWVFQERQVREEAFLLARETLARHARESGDLGTAEHHLRRAVGVDPLRESAQRALMQTLAGGGNYAAALQVYRELRLHLHQELNVAPDPETVALFEQLRAEARQKAAPAPTTAPTNHPTGRPAPGKDGSRELGAGSGATLTFLFTDVEVSTRLWEQHPEAMRHALARHDDLLRRALQSHSGAVFKTVGDAFYATFSTAPDAVAAVLEAQCALQSEPWGEVGSLRVRMALHTGVAELRSGDYFGPPLNRVARLLEIGHGGQVLLSAATQELVCEALPEGTSLRDLGECRLKDLARPDRVFQLLHADLVADFPPLRGLDAWPHNLPAQPTPLIGREHDVAAVGGMLRRDAVRLVTLTGPGGTGKTRLALQVAADLVDAFPDGVFFVDLAPIRDPALVASAIAQSLGVRESADQPLLESLKSTLREKQLLLVLDNFEQVLKAGSVIVDLLAAAPRLKVLVTSRAVLRLRGEHDYPVPPLALPDPQHLPPVEALSQYAAVELFIQRALAAKPDFTVSNENAPAVAEICHRLDGLPLVIELAATRIRLFRPGALLSRLESRLKALTGGARDLPPRQQTLRSAIAWSHDLLEEEEKTLFRRLSVFVGGFTLEAAEAVCDPEPDGDLDVLDGVSSLVEKSLLHQIEGTGDEPRFRMLETIREYGLECLEAAGEAEATRRRHAQFFLALAEAADPNLRRAERREWLPRLIGDHANLRAALAWSQEEQDGGELALRLAGALIWFWDWSGDWTEGREWLGAALERSASAGRTRARAKALFGAGYLELFQGDLAAARSSLEEAVAIWREVGENGGLAVALTHLALAPLWAGDPRTASILLEESIALSRLTGEQWNLFASFLKLGDAAGQQGNRAAEWSHYEEALAVARDVGDPTPVAWSLLNLGGAAMNRGDYLAARPLVDESVALFRDLDDNFGLEGALGTRGSLARFLGDYETARHYLAEAVAIRRRTGARRRLVSGLCELGIVAREHGDYEIARSLCEEALAISRERGDPWTIALCLGRLGSITFLRGDVAEAQALLEESLALWRSLAAFRKAIAWSLVDVATVADVRGEFEAASAALEESLSISQDLDDKRCRAWVLQTMGRVAHHRGDRQLAQTHFRESLALFQAFGEKRGIEQDLEALAAVAEGEQQPVRAARLFGAAAALRDAMHCPVPPVHRADHERHLAAVQTVLGEEAFAAAWAEGRALSLEEVVALALDETREG